MPYNIFKNKHQNKDLEMNIKIMFMKFNSKDGQRNLGADYRELEGQRMIC